MESKKRVNVEIELGNKNKRIFLIVYLDPVEIWIDLKGLPATATLCAMVDGTPFIQSKCGAKGRKERVFVNIEWAIHEWGGDAGIVEALEKRKQMTLEQIPGLKKKYGNNDC